MTATTRPSVNRAVASACADLLAAVRAELHPTDEQLARIEARVEPIAAELVAEVTALVDNPKP